jgi:hypothetical protein
MSACGGKANVGQLQRFGDEAVAERQPQFQDLGLENTVSLAPAGDDEVGEVGNSGHPRAGFRGGDSESSKHKTWWFGHKADIGRTGRRARGLFGGRIFISSTELSADTIGILRPHLRLVRLTAPSYSVVHRPCLAFKSEIYARKAASVLHPRQGCAEAAHVCGVPEMPKRPSVKSTVKQLLDAGLQIARVEVSADKVIVFAGKPGGDVTAYTNPWDSVLDHAQDEERAA